MIACNLHVRHSSSQFDTFDESTQYLFMLMVVFSFFPLAFTRSIYLELVCNCMYSSDRSISNGQITENLIRDFVFFRPTKMLIKSKVCSGIRCMHAEPKADFSISQFVGTANQLLAKSTLFGELSHVFYSFSSTHI